MTQENQTEQIENEIEISIEQARGAVMRKDAMDALIADANFNKIFTEGYMQEESSRLVSLLADDEWQTPEKQKSLVDDMRAISSLRQYIMNIRALGRQMERQIAASESTLEELRTEGE